MESSLLTGYLTALGLGLLIGTERERRKGDGRTRAAAGLRTFTIAALLGAVSWQVGQVGLLALALLAISALTALSYWRGTSRDPGLTTEITLLLTTLLGGMALVDTALAAGLGVIVTMLLAARTPLHRFAHYVLTEQELQDAILLAAAALVILPLAPDRTIDPLEALNPHTVWQIVVLMLAISGFGHMAGRALGARHGLPLAGFISGFISSSATISALGSRARAEPALHAPAVAGAVLSTIATFIQMTALLHVINPALLTYLLPALLAGGGMALLYGLFFALRALQNPAASLEPNHRPLNPLAALAFAGIVATISVGVALLNHFTGQTGAILGTALAGLADTHAASASVAGLAAHGTLPVTTAAIGVMAALTTNTATKIILAWTMGSRTYAREVIPGLLLVMAAVWTLFIMVPA